MRKIEIEFGTGAIHPTLNAHRSVANYNKGDAVPEVRYAAGTIHPKVHTHIGDSVTAKMEDESPQKVEFGGGHIHPKIQYGSGVIHPRMKAQLGYAQSADRNRSAPNVEFGNGHIHPLIKRHLRQTSS